MAGARHGVCELALKVLICGMRHGTLHSCHLELHDSSFFLQDYNAADMIVMTIIRCVAVLYSYYKFCHLRQLGSKYILGKSVVAVDTEMQICVNIYICNITPDGGAGFTLQG
jgi:hypothetical protein